jgi:hypothetical protein
MNDLFSLERRTALVTGGSRTIGGRNQFRSGSMSRFRRA